MGVLKRASSVKQQDPPGVGEGLSQPEPGYQMMSTEVRARVPNVRFSVLSDLCNIGGCNIPHATGNSFDFLTVARKTRIAPFIISEQGEYLPITDKGTQQRVTIPISNGPVQEGYIRKRLYRAR